MQSDRPSLITLTTSTYQPCQPQHHKSISTLTNSVRNAPPSFTKHHANGRSKLVVAFYAPTLIIMNTINSPSITVKPNVRTYSTVIGVYSCMANCNLEGAEAAQHLLEHLRKLYKMTGDEELKPNVISYNTVIIVWAKTGTRHGAETVMKLLDTMEREGIADVISFNACIHAWARCGSKESGERTAESVLKQMKERLAKAEQMNNVDKEGEYKDEGDEGAEEFNFNQSLIRPNIRTYSSVIDAWS